MAPKKRMQGAIGRHLFFKFSQKKNKIYQMNADNACKIKFLPKYIGIVTYIMHKL